MAFDRRAYQREYQRRWKAANRERWLSENGPCVECGSWTDLEVDHVDPSMKVSHKVWSWSRERRAAELAKCVVRCRACHMRKSATEKQRGSDRHNARFTEAQVSEIRADVEAGVPQIVLARRFGVSAHCIWCIVHRETWKHVA